MVLLLKPSFIKDKSLHDNDIQAEVTMPDQDDNDIQAEVTKPDQDDNIMTDGLIVA